MNAPVTRRALLGATAAIGAVGLPAAAMPVLASPTPTASATASALHDEFRAVAHRHRVAMGRFNEAEAATVYLAEPEALMARPDDGQVLRWHFWDRHWSGKGHWYGKEEKIERLRAEPYPLYPVPGGGPNVAARVRRDEIVDAYDRHKAAEKLAEDASGQTAAQADWDEASEAYDAFRRRLIEMRTADPDVIRLKAAVVLERYDNDLEYFDKDLSRVLRHDGPEEEALCFSLMRDMVAQVGGVAP